MYLQFVNENGFIIRHDEDTFNAFRYAHITEIEYDMETHTMFISCHRSLFVAHDISYHEYHNLVTRYLEYKN